MRTIIVALFTLAASSCVSDEELSTDSVDSTIRHFEWHREADVANADAYREVLAELRDVERGTFVSDKREGDWEIEIAYAIARARTEIEKGAIVVVNGRSETFEEYGELVYDLTRAGYTLYLFDHRGQGRSGRMINFDKVGDSHYQKGTVGDFGDYVVDLQKFVTTIVRPDRAGHSSPLFALGHSMGGTVLTLYASHHSDMFDKIALSSPMFGLDVRRSIGFGLALWLHPHDYATGGAWSPDAFDHNALTTSRARFEAKQAVFADHRGLRVGGPTFDWVDAALDATDHVAERAGRVDTPILLLSAANDRVVETSAHGTVCDEINAGGGDCRLVRVRNARHEPLIETDTIRSKVLDTLVDFLEH